MKIEILGTGCGKCFALEKTTRDVVIQMGENIEVVKVDNIMEIMKYNILSMPGFVIDGKLLSTGKALSAEQVREYIEKAKKA